MGQGDRETSTITNLDRFRTPDKPASSSKLKRAPARLGSFADTPGRASTSNPSAVLASRSGERNSSRAQPTLTQIDFVTVSQQPESDDDFDYIGDSEKDTREVIEIEDDKDERDDSQGADYMPSSTSRAKRNRGIRFDTAPSKPKKVSLQGEGALGKGRRKSGDKKEKGAQKDDKTLTQMNYVQRILVEPDADLKLEYAYITPKKRDSRRQTINANNADGFAQQRAYISESSTQQKRRKLSLNSEEKCDSEMESNPVTPRKSIRTEVPSSQSPESPGVAFITSSQFRSATRSPQKPPFTLDGPYIKKESPGSQELRRYSKSFQTVCIDEKPLLNDKNSLPSPPSRQSTTSNSPKAKGPPKANEAPVETSHSSQCPGPSQRTVVYETDAESDYGGFDDDPPDVPSSPIGEGFMHSNHEAHVENESNFPDIESQELPPLPVPEHEIDSGPFPFESSLLSDASICYQRLHPATQFPLEPVPTINTQKMVELFPEESNCLHTLTPSPSSSPMKSHLTPKPEKVSQTQHSNQERPESQDVGRTPAEVVPESSPVARHEDSAALDRRAPAARDIVVQVESSQPIDRAHGQRMAGQNPVPRRMLSRSQILTSSVMESIPIPAFWMSSQDSVGEPYCPPDT